MAHCYHSSIIFKYESGVDIGCICTRVFGARRRQLLLNLLAVSRSEGGDAIFADVNCYSFTLHVPRSVCSITEILCGITKQDIILFFQ